MRVSGRGDAFSLAAPFHLAVWLLPGGCSSVSEAGLPDTSLTASPNNYKTIILTDLGRMTNDPDQRSALQAKLDELAARDEVAGVMVDVGSDARVWDANEQADQYFDCPYAKNLVADAIT